MAFNGHTGQLRNKTIQTYTVGGFTFSTDDLWRVAMAIILILAVASRFYVLGARAISHDESIHTKFSWNLYTGNGFQHNPMMHGPLLFHMTALNYFLFGANDFTSRIFTSLAGVALVMLPLLFQRWLGKKGALIASILLLISPTITYYSRYIRHDVLSMVTAVILMWSCFKYLEDAEDRWLYWMAGAFSFLYTTKEVSYIYNAIFGALLLLPFAGQVLFTSWSRPDLRKAFILVVIFALLMGAGLVLSLGHGESVERSLDESGNTRAVDTYLPWWGRIAAVLGLVSLLGAVVLAFYGLGEERIRQFRLFDLLMLMGTLTLPLGSALLIKLAGFDPLDYSLEGIVRSSIILVPMLLGSALLGIWWDMRRWPIAAAIHYAIFLVFFTTIFTNGTGIASGLVGGLGYWLAQQGVKRGGQPWYYYLLMTPLYEYLPLLFSIGGGARALAFVLGRENPTSWVIKGEEGGNSERAEIDIDRYVPLFFLGWTLASWAAYTYAGEKMPWLIVHIALPSIFMAAWGLNHLLEKIDWYDVLYNRGALLFLALPLTVIAIVVLGQSGGSLMVLLGQGVSPAGMTLDQLEMLGRAIGGLVALLAFGSLLGWVVSQIGIAHTLRLSSLTVAIFLAFLTVRTMVMANFINYDLANEFLVYAHSTPDVKIALDKVEEISWRTNGSANDIKVAYGEDGSWPFVWYMSIQFPNAYYFGKTPDAATLLECPAAIVGQPEWEAVDAILGADYTYFEYNYLWWPIQDYYDLTGERISSALSDPVMRQALWDIIWKRDYRRYAEATEKEITFKNWPYHKDFRLYVRRDLAQEVWSYSMGPEGIQESRPEPTSAPDPYLLGQRTLPLVSSASLPGASPRGLTLADDGSLYVADTAGHRIWHIEPDGEVLGSWGAFGVAPGEFNEPWDVAVDRSGTVYVADTWNHRVQVFDAQGVYQRSWGSYLQVDAGITSGESSFFGPRAIAIGTEGNIYITDTGNKRIQVFSPDGNFIWQFGSAGRGEGQFDEPVGIAVSPDQPVYVADTWNYRVQVLAAGGAFLRQWSIPSWQSNNPEEKPFLALDSDNNVYVSDPSHGRVLAFTTEGTFLWAVNAGDDGTQRLTFPEGLVVSPAGILYVADAHAGQVFGYELP
ncbi:MAG: TIGR03663 family protein [Anaerolineae bacterium]|nr:TIGR03663 family protein [Anaerolineae bacterium]